MGSNRKRPFGYRMEFGEIVLHPTEAETVRWIYDHYLAGASYSALVDKLRERGVPYDEGRPWNKNMVARILADRRCTGEAGFPQIIPEGQFRMVQVRRRERTTPCQKSPAQKELRKLCGGSPPAWVERQVLGLLNRLIQHPEL
ncbi:recombinase family protein, partial [Flavonifractor sp. An306]|uniref:recombinase family protein n=1 Tax=Flavonifractor sp. An306 TaxID=1965629 RepID=UPI001748D2F2